MQFWGDVEYIGEVSPEDLRAVSIIGFRIL